MARNRGGSAVVNEDVKVDAPEGDEVVTGNDENATEGNEVTDTATAPEVDLGEFLDELPGITRSQESGVWSKRLAEANLEENPGKWRKIWATEKAPHPTVNMLRSGKAAGVNADNYEFAGRTIDEQGYVFARFLTDEQKAERDAKRAAAKEKAASN